MDVAFPDDSRRSASPLPPHALLFVLFIAVDGAANGTRSTFRGPNKHFISRACNDRQSQPCACDARDRQPATPLCIRAAYPSEFGLRHWRRRRTALMSSSRGSFFAHKNKYFRGKCVVMGAPIDLCTIQHKRNDPA